MALPPSSTPGAPGPLAALGCGVAALTAATVSTASSGPARLPVHLGLFLAAGAAWALTLALLPRLRRRRSDGLVIVVIALALRVPAWLAPPAHSDDVYRYAWDGQLTRRGVNPYRHAPAAPELAPLRGGVAVELPRWERAAAPPPSLEPGDPPAPLWRRINNPDLPTIYPPAAQLLFALAASLPLPPVRALKLVLAVADLALLGLLARILARRGGDPRRALAWGWSPLAAIEIGQNAHLDAAAIALVVGALLAWESDRRGLAGLLLGAAGATKWVALPLLAVFRSSRTAAAAALCVLVLALPFVSPWLPIGAGPAGKLFGSTGEMARRWRSNDGLYALVQAATDRAVCLALRAPAIPVDDARPGPRCDRALDVWPHGWIATLISGRSYRASVYPDELSAFVARAVTLLGLGAIGLVVLVRRRREGAADLDRASEWLLGGLLLATPALHPWYALWLLPWAALTGRRAWIALAALVPLGYWPLAGWRGGLGWHDPVWTRLLEHGVCLGLLLVDALRARPPVGSAAARPAHD